MSNDVDGELPNNQTKNPPTHLSIPLGSASMATTTAPFSITRLPILKPPGPDTNYLDWILVINQVFKKAKLKYVLSPISTKRSHFVVCRRSGNITSTQSVWMLDAHHDNQWESCSKSLRVFLFNRYLSELDRALDQVRLPDKTCQLLQHLRVTGSLT
ncbi:hypothetical protein MJO28_011869 [Puccinia striiformis f. sp. tritici]|uniref:Uncharacterized protein n=2 Tax=Puccinia striiformis f. sp. tritici TaxID=168172 RepID=A0A0L0W0N2_9BASI|nr:hypothetical protein Pst134EA_021440 [Puccinia striiformis f. sp. tritici]KAH9457567.1 hypothetical protein Pst134EA_021440 [Puccinia striiformis f. sp. tritici]KAI7944341.1 hypothetical protein MJO28_011869 [Puccinia striiformis f. sp. tritici]KAI9617556.1 hypothetical protein H4Q26_012854 [Puccinia striiformis f. sp. tritici PST-130]KNF04845.1 hypothetical protein PSTG_01899 [Puccinia striiformis f. sp. tritici PST-78]